MNDHLSRAGGHVVVLAVLLAVAAVVGVIVWVARTRRSRAGDRHMNDRDEVEDREQ
jgi:hypothetical protein